MICRIHWTKNRGEIETILQRDYGFSQSEAHLFGQMWSVQMPEIRNAYKFNDAYSHDMLISECIDFVRSLGFTRDL